MTTNEEQIPVRPPPEWIIYIIVCALALLAGGTVVAAITEKLK
jgi:hypothetical protein